MKTLTLTLAAILALPAGVVLAGSHVPGDPAAGEKVFRKCMACHAVGEGAKTKVGPVLNGVVGRDVAANADFAYSEAMVEWGADKQWTPEVLSTYLENPRGTVKGTKMAFAGLRKEDERQDVIAYLATFGSQEEGE
ncbi:c-type cytochrome [Palleronia rufa]|uniref:c-type cytochrome n=1 Tax=Palleronia rufa TaxID=1530186 RepID=UPI0005620B00|nr:cytochrome c family protein [Palleronia rufa]